MRTLLLAILLTFIAAPALAQGTGAGIPLNQEKEVSTEQREKRRATEEAYKSTIKNIPNAKPADPWGNMRGTSDASTGNAAKVKPAAKKSGGNLPN